MRSGEEEKKQKKLNIFIHFLGFGFRQKQNKKYIEIPEGRER
jgi:hypothetical protein